MLSIFAVKSSVSDLAELSGILDLPLFKNASAIEPLLSLNKDIYGRRILPKLRKGS